MSRDEIAAAVTALSDLARVVRNADPADKAEIYAKLKLTLTYQPEKQWAFWCSPPSDTNPLRMFRPGLMVAIRLRISRLIDGRVG
jgi:hypothetical protein